MSIASASAARASYPPTPAPQPGVKRFQRTNQIPQVFGRAPVTDVDIVRDRRGAVRNHRHAADDDELDPFSLKVREYLPMIRGHGVRSSVPQRSSARSHDVPNARSGSARGAPR